MKGRSNPGCGRWNRKVKTAEHRRCSRPSATALGKKGAGRTGKKEWQKDFLWGFQHIQSLLEPEAKGMEKRE